MPRVLAAWLRRGRDGVGGELIVVGEAVFVGLLHLGREDRVPSLGTLDAGALLGRLVPPLPVLPLLDLPRLPRERVSPEGYAYALAVRRDHAHGVLGEGHGVHDYRVLSRRLRVPERPIDLLVARLLQREVGPHLVERGEHVLGVPDNEGVGEPTDKLGAHHALSMVGHVLEEEPLLTRLEDLSEDVLVAVLGFWIFVRITLAQAIGAIVVGGGEGLVQDLDVITFDEDPLEGGRERAWNGPQRYGFWVSHLAGDQGFQPLLDGLDGDSLLLHRVPITDGDLLVVQSVEVHRHAEGRPRLVLAPVAASDGARVVVEQAVIAFEVVVDLPGHRRDRFLLGEREHSSLYRGDARVELEDGTLLAADLLLGVGVYQEGEHHAVGADGWLHDVGDVALARGLVEVREVLARVLLVLLQVVVGAVGYALQLRPAGEREVVLDVHAAGRVVRPLVVGLLALAEVLLIHTEVQVPVEALVDPVLVPLLIRAGLDEELHLHLLELARAEDEVARCDLVPKRLPDLGDPERHLHAARLQHVFEVDEDPLRRLGPQVSYVLGALDGPCVGLEHQIEGSDRGEIPPAVNGVFDLLIGLDDLGELLGR